MLITSFAPLLSSSLQGNQTALHPKREVLPYARCRPMRTCTAQQAQCPFIGSSSCACCVRQHWCSTASSVQGPDLGHPLSLPCPSLWMLPQKFSSWLCTMGGCADPMVPGLDAGAEKSLLLFSKNSPCFGHQSYRAARHGVLGTNNLQKGLCGSASSTGVGSTVRWACSWGQI